MNEPTIIIQRDASALRISGRIDLHTSPLLLKALRKKPRCYCLDLSDVSYMDSSGTATLIEGLRMARQDGQQLLLMHVPQAVQSALQLAGVSELFEVAN